MNNIQAEFERHQQNGYLGEPNGEDAYGYGRWSTEKQGEDGSSIPRQIERIHLAALRDHLRITLDMMYLDDGYTGFEFENRPALSKLLKEISDKPRAKHVVFEDIDRLSRDADWQQGYLLKEKFLKFQVTPHFFINPGSELERYVRGYIAQEGMKKDLERMKQGNLLKAKSGRVTAKRPAYGYVITDRKNSHYELHPEEAKIVRWMFEKVVYEGATLKPLCKWLNDNKVPTHRKGGHWNPSTVKSMINSPVYKGEFIANRYLLTKTGKYTDSGRPKIAQHLRPETEWIKVPVPAIVTSEEWEQAQQNLKRNSWLSLRNGKMRGWLLQSLVKCDNCKRYSFISMLKNQHPVRYYGCSSRNSERARMQGEVCSVPYAKADNLEAKVWEKIVEVIYDPSVIINRLEERQKEEAKSDHQSQLDHIEEERAKELAKKKRWDDYYESGKMPMDEYTEKMDDIKARLQTLEISKAKVEAKMAEFHSVEDKKKVVLAALKRLRTEIELARKQGRSAEDVPFDFKRNMLKLLVDRILVNTVNRTFTIEGEIKGTYAMDDPSTSSRSGRGFDFTSNRKTV